MPTLTQNRIAANNRAFTPVITVVTRGPSSGSRGSAPRPEETVFLDGDSPLAGLVRFVPIERLNAVLAISP